MRSSGDPFLFDSAPFRQIPHKALGRFGGCRLNQLITIRKRPESGVCVTAKKSKGAFQSTNIPCRNFGNSTCQMERYIPVAETRSKPRAFSYGQSGPPS